MQHVEEAEALRAGELIDLFTAVMLTQVEPDARKEILDGWEAARNGPEAEPEPEAIVRIAGPDALMHFALHPYA